MTWAGGGGGGGSGGGDGGGGGGLLWVGASPVPAAAATRQLHCKTLIMAVFLFVFKKKFIFQFFMSFRFAGWF